jgi:hypothetical protein
MMVFWSVMSCSLVDMHQISGDATVSIMRLEEMHLLSWRLRQQVFQKHEDPSTKLTVHVLEYHDLNTHCRENLKSSAVAKLLNFFHYNLMLEGKESEEQ